MVPAVRSAQDPQLEEQLAGVFATGHDGEPLHPCDPLELFDDLSSFSQQHEGIFSEAATLATADAEGTPSARQVLVKSRAGRKFFFFTDQSSSKGSELGVNPRASLAFWWRSLNVCFRVQGTCHPANASESDRRFLERHSLSRASAAVSQQSSPLRGSFEDLIDERDRELSGGAQVRPERWGGYYVVARSVECWQDQAGRLHKRRRWVFNRGPIAFCAGMLHP